jgi:hypothetical protein
MSFGPSKSFTTSFLHMHLSDLERIMFRSNDLAYACCFFSYTYPSGMDLFLQRFWIFIFMMIISSLLVEGVKKTHDCRF